MDETRAFAALVGSMIPASEEYGVPGADDAAILPAILDAARSHWPTIAAGLATLDAVARERFDRPVVDLDPDAVEQLVDELRRLQPAVVALVVRLTAQCYYRDDRVMAALGMEVRAPYPEGYRIGPEDWSVLDPVRRRAPLFRDVPESGSEDHHVRNRGLGVFRA